jgi:glycosyltransferase involved in cell wall biosynthesis
LAVAQGGIVTLPQPRKKCLAVALQAPRMPGMGGEVRSYYLLKAATEVFDVTLVCLGGPDGAGVVQADLAARCVRVLQPADLPPDVAGRAPRPGRLRSSWNLLNTLLFPWRDNWRHFLTLLLQYRPGTLPAGSGRGKHLISRMIGWEFSILSRFCSIPPMTCFMFDRQVRRLLSSVKKVAVDEVFDVLWVEHSLAWPAARQFASLLNSAEIPVICSGHNVEYLVCERMAVSSQLPGDRWFHQLQAVLMHRMERQLYRRSALIFQCSKIDLDITARETKTAALSVIGNGVNGTYFRDDETIQPDSVPLIVFTAGFGYGPNRDAVVWFLDLVFPLVQQSLPGVRFLFAGAQAGELAAVAEPFGDAVEVVSSPVDIRPCFQRATVYVVPLQSGGGTRLKILEAMSMRRAVVSTTVGAEGVEYEHGRHLLLADSPEDFAACVIDLVQNAERRRDLTANAASFVREFYEWDSLAERTVTTLKQEFGL